jgi:type VI secretion system protein ImpH
MATAYGHAAPALNVMARTIREYSVFQAVLLTLDTLRVAHPGLNDEELYEHIEFQTNPGLGFPGSDIDRVEYFCEHGMLRARLRLNMLGLSGAGSPLPAFYAQQALEDGDANPTRMFLDLLNHRVHRLLTPIWRRYRYRAAFRKGATDPFSRKLFALIGLAGDPIRQAGDINWKRLLPYLGLLSLRAHSAALIEAVLRYYFGHAALSIQQCLLRTVEIQDDQLNKLGIANSQMGQSLVLGERIKDRNGKFRVHIHELSWERFHEFLPIGTGYQPLLALVRFSLRDPLTYDIRLVLRRGEIRDLRLSTVNDCRLGWSSWLGRDQANGVVTLGSTVKRTERKI